MSALSVRGLTVARAGRVVLQDASFSAPAASVTCVLGPAGAGKTSLLAAIAGLLPAERGAVLRGAVDITRVSSARRGVAMLSPGVALPERSSVGAALRRLAGSAAAASIGDRLAFLDSPDLAAQSVGLLSHGEGLLALTAARLGPQGGVLLVDEAAMGLDDAAQDRLGLLLRGEAASGRLVLVATRSTRFALRVADHLVLLSGGCVLQAGTPASLYAEPRDAAAARLTGPANILAGTVRELRPGGFVWAASSNRHLQAAGPGAPRPSLGSSLELCLRPERIVLLGGGEAADNVAEGGIVDVRSVGALLDVRVETRLGPLLAAVPSWSTVPYPAQGQGVRLGWAASAATILG